MEEILQLVFLKDSFNDKPWSVSDVERVQCKSRHSPATTAKTTTTTTNPTTTTTVTNPNTHEFCNYFDGWTSECTHCYSYTLVEDYFYNEIDYRYYYEDYTCELKISTVCDANFVDKVGLDCNFYASRGLCGKYMIDMFHLGRGFMSDEGLVTQFNCPQCGCGENGPSIRFGDL